MVRMTHLMVGVLAGTSLLASVGSAAVIQTNYFSATSQTDYPVSGTSLILNTADTHESTTASASLNGGVTPTNNGELENISYLDSAYSITYTLDTTANSAGYDITSIATISGWSASRIAQNYDVTYTTVTGDTVTLATNVNHNPGAEGSLKIALTDSGGLLATGVKSITFNIFNPGFGTVWRELEVEGSATPVPEPAAMGLLGIAALGLMRRRR